MENIVTKLYQYGVPSIVEKVFSYLDYSDIKNAMLVSCTWSNILNDSEVNVWKSLWYRSMEQIPAWSLLNKRAITQGSYKLESDPSWNFKEACHFIGDAHEKLLSNWQLGTYKEKREEKIGILVEYSAIGATKVIKSLRGNNVAADCNKIITIQSRWRPSESGLHSIIEVGDRQTHIIQLEINEPYLVVATIERSVSIWNLERNEKIYEFYQPIFLDNMYLVMLDMKLSSELIITCSYYEQQEAADCQTVLTSRQMPNSTQHELDFCIAGQVKLPNFKFYSMYLEDQRVVLFNKQRSNFFIVSLKPLRLVRQGTVFSSKQYEKRQHLPEPRLNFIFGFKFNCGHYWKGWLLQNDNGNKLKITNIDTGENLLHEYEFNGKLYDCTIVKNKIVTLREDEYNLIFDIWNFPDLTVAEEKLQFICSIQQPLDLQRDNFDFFNWKVVVDEIQIWIFLHYNSRRLTDIAPFSDGQKKVFVLDFAD